MPVRVINVVRGDWTRLTGYASVVSGTMEGSKVGRGESRQREKEYKGFICSPESAEERGKGDSEELELPASESAGVMVTDFTRDDDIARNLTLRVISRYSIDC